MIIYEHILTFYAMIIYKRMITSEAMLTFEPVITSLLVISREKEKMSVYFKYKGKHCVELLVNNERSGKIGFFGIFSL